MSYLTTNLQTSTLIKIIFVFNLLHLSCSDNLVEGDISGTNNSITAPRSIQLSTSGIHSLDELKSKTGFFENKGQITDRGIKYYLQRGVVNVLIKDDALVYEIAGAGFITLNLENATKPTIKTGLKNKDVHNFIKSTGKAIEVSHFQDITLEGIYHNIDLHLISYPKEKEHIGFKYNFIIHPGGNPKDIKVRYDGLDQIELKEATEELEQVLANENNKFLHLTKNNQIIGEDLTAIYQEINHELVPVKGAFELLQNQISYKIEGYNKNETLIIDPDLVVVNILRSTYYGTEGTDRLRDVLSDSDGNIYTVGVTAGNSVNISTDGVFQTANNGNNDIIVAKFNANLSDLISATYYGGSEDEDAFALAIDDSDNIYVGGFTSSSDLPTANSSTYSSNGLKDFLIAKFSADMTQLQWLNANGGTADDQINDIAVINNQVFAVGTVSSENLNTIGDDYYGGNSDTWITEINVSNGNTTWSRYYGDNRTDIGNGLTLTNNKVFITGQVTRNSRDNKAFISEFDHNGSLIQESDYGDFNLRANDITISSADDFLVIVGLTNSGTEGNNDAGLTNLNHQKVYGGGTNDGFLIKVNTNNLSVAWSSYYGGTSEDNLRSVAIDCNENILLTGFSKSPNRIAENGFINSYQGGGSEENDTGDAILVKFQSNGERYWGSYFGDTGNEEGIGLTFGQNGEILLCGATASQSGITTTNPTDPVYDEKYSNNGKGAEVGFISTFCDVIVNEGPVSQTAPIGGEVKFTLATDYCGTIEGYQWYKNDIQISDGSGTTGSLTDVLTVSQITFEDAGEYCVKVETSCGLVETNLCAQLTIVELQGNNVCLDSASILNTPSINQDTIKLKFVDLEETSSITNATYQWSVSSSNNDDGGNDISGGSLNSPPNAMPTTAIDDLYEVEVLPSLAGTYTYKLIFEYDDSRRTDKVKDSATVTVEVYSHPEINPFTNQSICEGESVDIEVTSNIILNKIDYQRTDSNTTNLVGLGSGERTNINSLTTNLSISNFQNQTNTDQSARYRIIPTSNNGCIGKSESLEIAVAPQPELVINLANDTICTGTSTNLSISALTSPDYTIGAGTNINVERSTNSNITPNNSSDSNPNSLNIIENLTNTSSNIQRVQYAIEADFNGCSLNQTANIVVLPNVTLSHGNESTISTCSGQNVSLSFGSSLEEIPTQLNISFSSNADITGQQNESKEVRNGRSTNFNWTFSNSTSSLQTITATVTPIISLLSGLSCEGTSEQFEFSITPKPTLIRGSEETCENTPLSISLVDYSTGIDPDTYGWKVISATSNISGANNSTGTAITDNLSLSAEDEGSVTYRIAGSTNGCASDSVDLVVTVFAEPSLALSTSPFSDICNSSPIPITISATVDGVSPSRILEIKWRKDGTLISGESSQSIQTSESGEYQIEVTAEGNCVFSEAITINESERSTLEIEVENNNPNICSGDGTILTAKLSSGDTPNSYQWKKDGVNIDGEINDQLTVNTAGSYSVIANASSACEDESDPVDITFFPQPEATFSITNNFCPNTSFALAGINNNPSSNIQDVTWTLTGPDNQVVLSDDKTLNPTLEILENQNTDQIYSLQLRLESIDGCVSETPTQSFTVAARPKVDFSFPAINCPGEIQLTENTINTSVYKWEILNDDSDIEISGAELKKPTLTVTNSTLDVKTYQIKLTATNESECTDEKTVEFSLSPNPVMVIDGDLSAICNGTNIALNATSSNPGTSLTFSNLIWSIDNIETSTTNNFERTVINNGVFDSLYQISLTGINSDGCSSSSNATVNVLPDARAKIINSDNIACTPFTINENILSFEPYDNANTSDYLWQIDSSTTIINQSTDNTPPDYTITKELQEIKYILTATSKNGCQSDKDTVIFNSFENAKTNFQPSETLACEGLPILFENQSSNVSTYLWTFGDGNNSATPNPEHIFANNSFTNDTTFTVKLLGTSPDGCKDSLSSELIIHPLPDAAFTTPTSCAGDTIIALNESIGKTPLTYQWSLESDDPANLENNQAKDAKIILQDEQGGDLSVNVQLLVRSSDLCETTIKRLIDVSSRPVADIASLTFDCVADAVPFENISINNSNTPDSIFVWSFSDGAIVSTNLKEDITHQFDTTGNFEIRLKAVNKAGCIDSTSVNIDIFDIPKTVISKNQNPISGCAPVAVLFNSNSSTIYNHSESYNWRIGSSIFNSPTTDTITFEQNNTKDTTYYITLSIANSCGTSTSQDSIFVRPSPIADFSTVFNLGCDDIPVEIINESVGLPEVFIWNFGDGSFDTTSNQEDFSHIFQNNGLYDTTFTVELTAINQCDTSYSTYPIRIIPFNDDSRIRLDASKNKFCENEEIIAIASGNTDNRQLEWYLNGNPIDQGNDTLNLSFPEEGQYELVLLMDVPVCNNSSSDTIGLFIEPGPDIGFTVQDSICLGELLQIQNTGQVKSSRTKWTFGDGYDTTAISPDPYLYDQVGIYSIEMSLIGNNQCVSLTSTDVYVEGVPEIEIIISNQLCEDNQITFSNAQNQFISSRTWSIPELNIFRNNPTFEYTFAEHGQYNIQLEAYSQSDDKGCFAVASKTFSISPKPDVKFEITNKVCADSSITINNITQNTAIFDWSLMDENKSFAKTLFSSSQYTIPSFNIDEWGDYFIKLKAISPEGCLDSISKPISVVRNPLAEVTVIEDKICNGIGFELVFNSDFPQPNSPASSFKWFVDNEIKSTTASISPALTQVKRERGETKNINYKLQVTHDICENTWEETMVIPGFFGCIAQLPNSFTPNGDGINDLFNIIINPVDYDNFTHVELQILSDTQNLIYELILSRDNSNSQMECIKGCPENYDPEFWYLYSGWNGAFQGNDNVVHQGTYFYRLKTTCCEGEAPRPQTGNFLLLK